MAQPHRAGFVALVGEPNVGKSTLLNRLLGQKVAIVSPRPQTTRNRILGILTQPGYQLALLDTPGLHQAKGALHRAMRQAAQTAVHEVDLVALVVDATRQSGPAKVSDDVRDLLAEVRSGQRRSALLLNKVDRVPKPALLPLLDGWSRLHAFDLIYPLSALTGENADRLPAALADLLPEGPPLFPADVVTDQVERVLAAELVREQVFRQLRQEVPYGVAVEIESFDEAQRRAARPLVRIHATLHVERASQKAILIGKGGARLKAIGSAARREIEALLGCQIFLGLNVRIEEHWSDSERAIHRFGYGPKA